MEGSQLKDASIYVCDGAHRTEYPDPIRLSAGELVTLGERAPEENWKEWIWAEKASGQGGWIPHQLIELVSVEAGIQRGISKEDYSADELNVDKGDAVIKIKSINGWTWVRNINTGQEGWIPDEIIGQRHGA
jgi:hypothetical protein